MATTAKTYRPEQIASALGISGKIVRAYLRKTYARPIDAKGSTWVLNEKMAKDTIVHFRAKNPAANAPAAPKKTVAKKTVAKTAPANEQAPTE